MREEVHYHRKPLTEDQITRLVQAVEGDDFCRPLILCGLSTAMRLGDCCQLKWADVDFPSPTPSITVKTSKTGETVCIPVYERLARELEIALSGRKRGEKFVWPGPAALHQRQHCLVSKKLRSVFILAVGEDLVHEDRANGHRKASVIDFHSLRTTWITEALSRGVPIETVKRISGHKTVEVVTKHYYHPSKKQVRQALEVALPLALTNGNQETASPLDEAVGALETMSAKNWKQRRKAALAALQGLRHAAT